MTDGSHVMTLEDYAKLAQMRPYPQHEGGMPIIITPTLARALNTLIEAANDVAVAGPLADALAGVKALHDFETVRLGGERR